MYIHIYSSNVSQQPVPTSLKSMVVLPLSDTTASPGLTMGAVTSKYRVSSGLCERKYKDIRTTHNATFSNARPVDKTYSYDKVSVINAVTTMQ